MIVAESRTNRRRIAAHQAVLRTAFPADGPAMRRWLVDPGGPIAGLSTGPGNPGAVKRVGTGERKALTRAGSGGHPLRAD